MNKRGLYLAAIAVVLIIFQITYGLGVLVPTNVNWLMSARHDWGTHYLGWFFYRNEPWHLPLGKITHYYYPVGTNVGFTDSIPLMAIFFKLFNGILPADFQYFGLWLFLCDLLVAGYTIRLLQLFNCRPITILLGVILVVANPVLVYRGLHPALCAHWLFLGSIYYYFLDPAKVSPTRILRSQLILLTLSAVINPYLCCMVLGFSIILPAKLLFYDKVISIKKALGYTALSLFTLLALWIITGMITLGKQEDLNVSGAFGLYSMNLNAFFNSFGFSRFLPQLPWVSWHQYEGYMYLGLGMFLLLAVLLVYRIASRWGDKSQPAATAPRRPFYKSGLLPLYILVLLYTLFALTNVISLNDKVLFRVPLPDLLLKLGDIYRASSRFFWPCYYLLLLFSIVAASKMRLSGWMMCGLLALTVTLQFVDYWRLLSFRHFIYGAYTPPLDPGWKQLIAPADEVVIYPPFEASYVKDLDYQDFSFLAAKANKPITTGYVARVDNKATAAYTDSLINNWQNGRVSKALYITTPANLEAFANPLLEKKLRLGMLDGYCYLYSDDSLKNPGLNALSEQLDLRSSKQLDSLRRTVQPNVFRQMTTTGEIEKGKLVYYIERMKKGKNFISISGWGVVDQATTNKGDSIYTLLLSDKKTYSAVNRIIKRPDITARFKGDMDDAGFKGVISTGSVDSGQYKIAIGIRTPPGKNIIYEVTDSILRIDGSHLVY